MIRRKFLQSVGAVGALDVLYKDHAGALSAPMTSAKTEREEWVALCSKVAEPLLTALAADRLKECMPFEGRTPEIGTLRKKFTHLEGFGRLLSGIAPWIELGEDSSPEGRLRAQYFYLHSRF